VAGVGMCEFLRLLSETPFLVVVMIEMKYSVLWWKQAGEKVKLNLNAVN